ncbi:MAG: U32 family peptidase [Christensenella sp.]
MELLAPAGDRDSLKAAIENGADAVYIGAQNFSARNLADNFDNIETAALYAHKAHTKLYLALNTLVRDREIPAWLLTAKNAALAGIDAFIVQDLGCAMLLKELCPNVPLHASTQMTAMNTQNVRVLQKLGFARAIPARELSFAEICTIKRNTQIPLEIFVHGALCVSYSGQCLMSSIFGGRSANRGLCAQPCRLNYSANGKSGRLLSPRDLCLIDYIGDLAQMGIQSVKIEGRMKSAQYVGTVTRIYRKALDGKIITKRDKEELLQAYSGRGFTDRPFADALPASPTAKNTSSESTMPTAAPSFSAYTPLKKGKKKKPNKLAAQVMTLAQAKSVLPLIDILYVPYDARWARELPHTGTQIIGIHPTIQHDSEISSSPAHFDGEAFGTLNDTDVAQKIADISFNVTNSETLKVLRSMGYKRATLSAELNAAQIADLSDVMPTEIIAYGRLTLMTTMRCPMHCDKKNCLADTGKTAVGKAFITDRMRKKFPVIRVGKNCRVAILNSEPVYMADKISMLSANVLRLVFTIETPTECAQIAQKYRDAMNGKPHPPQGDFTRGHFTRGVK